MKGKGRNEWILGSKGRGPKDIIIRNLTGCRSLLRSFWIDEGGEVSSGAHKSVVEEEEKEEEDIALNILRPSRREITFERPI